MLVEELQAGLEPDPEDFVRLLSYQSGPGLTGHQVFYSS
jgi:hypothetical protein